jgi:hypothetical protein
VLGRGRRVRASRLLVLVLPGGGSGGLSECGNCKMVSRRQWSLETLVSAPTKPAVMSLEARIKLSIRCFEGRWCGRYVSHIDRQEDWL